ncbi:MAG: hypothetical protein ACKO3N_05605, partial [Verrucomicrobiota bacterium]
VRGSPSFSGVSPPEIEARRATVEDLPALEALWQRAGLPAEQLEKFVTEFQVVEDGDGVLRGAIGLQRDGDQALLHSEALGVEEGAEAVRGALWARLQVLARNQGVVRLWTLEDAPFWRGLFRPATPAEIAGGSAVFADPGLAWWTLQLVDLARLEQMAQQQALLRGDFSGGVDEQFQETVRRIRLAAYGLAGLVILLLAGFALYALMHREILQRALQR